MNAMNGKMDWRSILRRANDNGFELVADFTQALCVKIMRTSQVAQLTIVPSMVEGKIIVLYESGTMPPQVLDYSCSIDEFTNAINNLVGTKDASA